MYNGFVYQVARMDIREKQHICIALDLPVGGPFVLCRFCVYGKVKRERSVYDTARNLTLFAHFCQLSRIHRGRHLGIYHLHRCQRRHLGHIHAAGIAHRNRILDDIDLVLQRRIGHEGHICQKQKPVNAGNLKYAYMGQRIACAQAHFLVQHALQEILGVNQSLHVHVSPAVMCQFHRLQGSCNDVRLINDLIAGQIHID